MNAPSPHLEIHRLELRRLLDYWQAKRAKLGRLPGRADIDPLEMRFALGHLILADVEPGPPPRFRHRLVGTQVVERAGYDATGLYIDEMSDADLAVRILPSYEQVVATRAPVSAYIKGIVGGRPTDLELLRLPLSATGAEIDMVLTGAYFTTA